jgi:elongation factor P
MDIEDIHKNSKLLIDGTPYNVVDAEFVKPGKGRAIYRLRLQNLRDGSALDRTYHSSEKVDEAPINVREEQFLYKEHDALVFMNTETFEQTPIPERLIGDKQYYLKEGTVVQVLLLGDEPLDITIPTFVEMKVVESAVSNKTDTITGQGKEAIMDTGLKVEVPTFVKEGDVIKVDTRTGIYVERITKTK